MANTTTVPKGLSWETWEDRPLPVDAILTYTGRVIRPLDPDPELIDIEDIAHALSNVCRYTGHTRFFYSVAQHSVLVSENLPEEFALWGLLHDAPEAYLSDVARPIKVTTSFGEVYNAFEEILMKAIQRKFGLKPRKMPMEVKAMDDLMLCTEASQLMPPNFPIWLEPLEHVKIEYTPPPKANKLFLESYERLTRS